MNLVDEKVPLKNQGLVLVGGKNGAGKSSIFIEGPYYALYGRSFKYGDRPGDEVVNDYISEGEDSYVKLLMDVDGVEYTIVRARSSAEYPLGLSVYHNGKDLSRGTSDATQELVNSLIGMGPVAFAHSVVFSSNILKFPTLKDSEKKEVFDELLQLQVLTTALEETKAILKKLKDAKKSGVEKKKFVTETIKRLAEDEAGTSTELSLWESGRVDRIEALKEIIWDFDKKLKKLKEQEDGLGAKLADAKTREKKLDKAYGEMEDLISEERDSLFKAEVTYSGEYNRLSNEGHSLENEKSRLLKLLNQGKCPTCQQPMSGSTLSDDVETVDMKLSKVKAKLEVLAAIREDLDEAASGVNEAKAQLAVERSHLSEASLLVQTLTDKYDIACEEYEDAAKLQSKQEVNLSFEEKADNPYTLKLSGIQSSLKAERVRLKEVGEELAAIEEEIAEETILEHTFGPKGARLLMIRAALPLLNAEAMKVQSIMGTKLSVSFKLKSSEEAYGGSLVTEVFNPRGAKSYKGDSKGEQACVDWILLLSLLALVSSRGKKSISQAFYDEVFDGLDDENEVGVLNVLKDISSSKSSVFMLSHGTEEIGGQCDRVWTVSDGKLIQEAA